MSQNPTWIEVPLLLDALELAPTEAALTEAGVPHRSETVQTDGGETGVGEAHVLHVDGDHLETTAAILRELFSLEDPEEDAPFTGECPACETALVDAWSCPGCEIDFRSPYDPADPLIVFVREHGGFRDPDRDALRQMQEDGADLSVPMPIDFIVAVPDEAIGTQVARAAAEAGYETAVTQDEGEWTCICTKTMLATYEGVLDAQDELDEIAEPLEGFACGWTTDGNAG